MSTSPMISGVNTTSSRLTMVVLISSSESLQEAPNAFIHEMSLSLIAGGGDERCSEEGPGAEADESGTDDER